MRLELVTGPASEPLTMSEVRKHLKLDDEFGEPAPGAPTVALASPAAAGNVDNGVHRYRVTFVTADGETHGGTISSPVTVSDKTVNGRVALSAIPTGGSAVTSRKIYRTAAGGSTYLLVATIADNTTTTYTDNIADSSLGAEVPSTNTTEDPELRGMIQSAREQAETASGRVFITQTWRMKLDCFPGSEIVIPVIPLISVSSVKYIDEDGNLQTVSTSDYVVDTSGVKGRIYLAYEAEWPVHRDEPNAVRIEFVAGYGAASAVPYKFKSWMLLRIGELFALREGTTNLGGVPIKLPNMDGMILSDRVGF